MRTGTLLPGTWFVTSIKHVQSVCVSHERWTNAECNAREKHVSLTAIN